jgi:hypothetical protein
MGKVRRSGRIAKEIRILLLGMDINGAVFSEETRTVTLSRHGAGIISKHKLAKDGLLIMRFLGGTTETAIRLVGQFGTGCARIRVWCRVCRRGRGFLGAEVSAAVCVEP